MSVQTIELTVNKSNGLHVRMVAALIARLQSLVEDSEVLRHVYLEHQGRKAAITSILALVALKVRKGDKVTFRFDREVPSSVIEALKAFLESADRQESTDENRTDQLLMENSTTVDVVLSSLPYGILVVNRENVITYVNREATRLLGRREEELLNQSAERLIPHSRLHWVLKTGKAEIGKRQKLGSRVLITNRCPIYAENRLIGAVALFQDISSVEKLGKELKEVKALKEQLDLVLQSVEELIGLFDPAGRLIYANAHLERALQSLPHKDLLSALFPTKGWKQGTPPGKSMTDIVHLDGKQPYIAKLNPVLVEGEHCGSVLTMSPLNDVKTLMAQLDLALERTRYLEKELSKHEAPADGFAHIIGYSGPLVECLSIASKAARTDSTVLITGESGTGKELVARGIHEASSRKQKPFIRVNCAAIPANLVESELFGHEKGAFTGALQMRRGKFELAHTGTLFLDEIGDLSLDLQAKLLRVIQEREFERVGGSETIKVDVRLVAATNRDLQKMVQAGDFREDLFYRLHVIPIHLPPLRRRKEDIPLLVDHFREKLNERLGKNIKDYESGFIKVLREYDWPGNVRELQNALERAMSMCEGDTLMIRDLPEYILHSRTGSSQATSAPPSQLLREGEVRTMEEYEKMILQHAIRHFPSFNQAAKALGLTHKTVAAKVRKYGLEPLMGKNSQSD
ncbi:sigma 54-interacting transcriptional regulator [Brevibacillus sp. SYP-B805]|nr:sigma 54-interacting transcriptional regulator [Brevibacillus sp. SYP-B805]